MPYAILAVPLAANPKNHAQCLRQRLTGHLSFASKTASVSKRFNDELEPNDIQMISPEVSFTEALEPDQVTKESHPKGNDRSS